MEGNSAADPDAAIGTAWSLRARWQTARDAYERDDSDSNSYEEQRRWDDLVDFIEANDLNGSEVDPRLNKEPGRWMEQ